jgi:hypothetical protein
MNCGGDLVPIPAMDNFTVVVRNQTLQFLALEITCFVDDIHTRDFLCLNVFSDTAEHLEVHETIMKFAERCPEMEIFRIYSSSTPVDLMTIAHLMRRNDIDFNEIRFEIYDDAGEVEYIVFVYDQLRMSLTINGANESVLNITEESLLFLFSNVGGFRRCKLRDFYLSRAVYECIRDYNQQGCRLDIENCEEDYLFDE